MTKESEISFEADGKTYIVNLSINSMCKVEEEAGDRPYPQILASMATPENISVGIVRLLFWGSLVDRQPKITINEAGELISAVGGITHALEFVTRAIVATGLGFEEPTTAGAN